MKMRNLLFAVIIAALGSPAAATGNAEFRDPWIRWLPGSAPMGGYFSLDNPGQDPLAVSGASSPAYGSVSLHRTSHRQDGTTSMQPVDLPLTVPGNSTIAFEPGGYHLMLRAPQHSISPGDRVTITLHLASGNRIRATFDVYSPAGK